MIYHILRPIILITVKVFFNSIYVRNIENIPEDGPLIIAPNHPSTFLDPLVTCAWIKRPVYFLTNGGAFSSPIKKKIYSSLNMIPIYRKQDSNEASSKNEEAFDACYDFLKNNGVLMIFPEGSSENERRLRKIKTGLARIALGAESKNDFSLNVKIVCVGINYTNPRKFQSKLFVNFDTPFNVIEEKENYLKDNFETVRKVTQDVSDRLESLIVKTHDERFDKLVRRIETLYTNNLKESLNLTNDQTEQIFIIAQYISDAVNYYNDKDKNVVSEIESKINNYFELLDKYDIRDITVFKTPSKNKAIQKLIKYIPQLILIFPIYIWGLIHNYIPFKIPELIVKKTTPDITYRGPVNFVTGMLTFNLFYLIYVIIFFFATKNILLTLLYFISLGFSGFVVFYYWNYLLRVFEELRLLKSFSKDDEHYSLRKLRDELINDLDNIKEKYLNSD
jgi:glycerol-3-phosphate O-acyltransferase/dihydroxyacetone phosphate acyltransferase